MQNLYTTALSEGYNVTLTDNPEKLNEPEGFKYNIFHYVSLFNDNNDFNLEKTNNWVSTYRGNKHFPKPKEGFEEALQVMIYKWNPGLKDKTTGKAIYHTGVFENMKNFLPRR